MTWGDTNGESVSGEPVITPPKHYKHDLVNVFGIWSCKICNGEARNMEQMEAVPCNRAYVAKLKEVDFWL